MAEDHECTANLASNPNDTVFQGGEVFVYVDCTECGTEFEIEYELADMHPA